MQTLGKPKRESGSETPDWLRLLLLKRGSAAVRCLLGSIVLAFLTLVCFRLHVNPTAVALLYLIVIVLVSLMEGFMPPFVISIIAIVCLDYFFTPPLFSFAMRQPLDIVALIAYLITSFVINRLVSKARGSYQEIQVLKKQLRLIVDTTPAMVHSAQPDGSLDYFNQRWLDYLGDALDDIKDWRWTSKIHPEDVEAFVEKWRSSVKTGDEFEAEARVRRADGTYRWMLHRQVPSRDARGNIIKWYGSSLDIEDRKCAEEKVRSNERELRTTIETIPTFIGTALPDGSVDFVSQKWLDYTGLSREQWLDDGWMTVTHPEDLGRAVEKWNAARAAGEPIEHEQRIRQANGTYRWFLGRNAPLRNADGKIVKWYGTLHDIDDRKRAEDALRRTENFLAQAVRIARVGVWVVKPPDISEYWSPIAFEIFEIDPAKGPPKNLEEYLLHVHPDDRERLSQEKEAILAQGQIFEYKYRIIRPDGAIRAIREVGGPISEHGVITRYIGAWMDITEEEERIDKLRRSEAYMAQAQHIGRVGSWSYSPHARCEHWSEEMFRIFGFDPSKGYPKNDAFVLHSEDRQRVEEELARMFKDGHVLDTKYRYFRPDGQMRVIRDVGAPVFENGVIARFVGACMDITEEEQRINQLRNSEEFLTEAQKLSHTGSFGWGVSTDEHFWSDETFRIFEYDASTKITLQLILNRVHPEDMPLVKQVIARAAEGKNFDFEYRLLLPSGIVKHLHVVAHAVKEESGNIEFIGAVMDITGHKHAEESRSTSEGRWRSVFENASVGIVLARMDGQFLAANLAYQKMIGYSETELLKFKPTDFTHKDDCSATEAILEALRKGNRDARRYEKRYVRKDGRTIWVECSTSWISAAGSMPSYFSVVVVDITERKLAEEAVRRSEAFLAEGQRLSHTGSWGWNVSTGALVWSREKFRLLGLDPETTKPSFELFWERVHPEDRQRLKQAIDSAVGNKIDFEQEYRIVTPDWIIRHLHDVGHAVINEANELVEFIGSAMDITDRKRAEERAQTHNEAIRTALNAFVEELDVNRFLGHVITSLTKQFQAASSELWLFDESSGTPTLFMTCQQGKVILAEAEGTNRIQSEGVRTAWEASSVGRIPRIIDIPTQESLLLPTHLESLKHQGIKTLAVVPLLIGEQNLGVFELRFQVATWLTPDDLDLAQAFVHHATLALQLSRLAHRTEQMAVTEERNRLAREIHDTLAQAFAGIVLHTEALGSSLGISKLRSKRSLSRIQKLARSGLEEARRSVRALRPKALDGSTLTEALEQEAKRLLGDAKLSSQFKQRGKITKLSSEVQNELFRIAQEALTNVVKHAQAKSVLITLEFKIRQVSLSVKDDGIGLSADERPDGQRGFGLATMSERAQRIGGRLRVESVPAGGTTIRVDVPMLLNRLK